MARNKNNRNPAPETSPETPPETPPETIPEPAPEPKPEPKPEPAEKAFLVMVRKAALGNGTRELGFVLGEIKDIENLSPEGIVPAEGVIEAEIINALANGDVYKVQA